MLDALGAAAVTTEELRGIIAELLGRDVLSLHDVVTEPLAYDVPSITTVGRHVVRGTAETATGPEDFAVFCKHLQAWERHPFFAQIPAQFREAAAAGIRWRTEPDVYASDLAEHLPAGLTMLPTLAVRWPDELSASVWLPAVEVAEAPWDEARYADTARLLGRLAARRGVREVAAAHGHGLTAWDYLHGRVRHQLVPMLLGDDAWRHPLVEALFDDTLREGLRSAARQVEDLVAELTTLPTYASHGDACPGNLLRVPGTPEVVLIDFGFFGLGPVGFDLGQLLVGEAQLGHETDVALARRSETLLAAYVEGMAGEGERVALPVVRRAHALQLMLWVGLSCLPVDVDPQAPEALETARGRAAIARHGLEAWGGT